MLADIIQTVLRIVKSRYSSSTVARDYLANIVEAAHALASGAYTKGQFLREVETLLEQFGTEAYEQAAGFRYAMEDADELLIRQWLDGQLEHLEGLATDIKRDGYTREIDARLRLWGQSLSTIGGVGYMQANRQKLAMWRRGTTEDGCETCVMLDGKIARLGWFLDNGYLPSQPGSAALSCGGWKCSCGLFDLQTGRRLLPLVRRW